MILWVKFIVCNESPGDVCVCFQALSGRSDSGLLLSSLPNLLPHMATATADIESSKYIVVAELQGRSDTDCLLHTDV
jgi:hypothetical protein